MVFQEDTKNYRPFSNKNFYLFAKVAKNLAFASTFDEKVNKTASFYVIFTVLIIENEEKSVILQCVFV